MKTTHCIDWLQYSLCWPANLDHWPVDNSAGIALALTTMPFSLDIHHNPESDHTPWRGYNTVYPFNIGDVNVHTERKEQKIGVVMSGEHLRTASTIGIEAIDLIFRAIHQGGKVTRLDFAIDIEGIQCDPLEVYETWEKKELITTARSLNPVFTATVDKDGRVHRASTVYIGARESDRFVRIYDKGAKEKTTYPWTRIELVLRDDRANYAAQEMVRTEPGNVGRYLLQNFLKGGPDWLQDAISGDTTYVQGPGRKQTKTQEWLLNTVLPTFQREARDRARVGDFTLTEAYQKAIQEITTNER